MTQQVAHAKRTLTKGSKTFNFAAMALDRQRLLGTRLLYTFCRVADDAVDNASSTAAAKQNVATLRLHIGRPGEGKALLTDPNSAMEPDLVRAIQAWREVEWLFDVPSEYALELIHGTEMDALSFRPKTTDDLLLYCYRVAGVVGLMMCYVLGVRDKKALQSAVDMGSAMQLTNIARDLREDFLMGRTYVPVDWSLGGTSTDNTVLAEADAFAAAKRLVAMADILYRSGRCGLYALPYRARIAVAIASRLYERIGLKIVSKGPSAIRSRMVVSSFEKLLIGAGTFLEVTAKSLWAFAIGKLGLRKTAEPDYESGELYIYASETACASQITQLKRFDLA